MKLQNKFQIDDTVFFIQKDGSSLRISKIKVVSILIQNISKSARQSYSYEILNPDGSITICKEEHLYGQSDYDKYLSKL